MSIWRRFVRWLARFELEEQANAYRSWSRMLIPEQPAPGTWKAVDLAVKEALRMSVPAAIAYSVELKDSADLEHNEILVVIYQPGLRVAP